MGIESRDLTSEWFGLLLSGRMKLLGVTERGEDSLANWNDFILLEILRSKFIQQKGILNANSINTIIGLIAIIYLFFINNIYMFTNWLIIKEENKTNLYIEACRPDAGQLQPARIEQK